MVMQAASGMFVRMVFFGWFAIAACACSDEGIGETTLNEVPAEPKWLAAASMSVARSGHQSLLLDNGRVLVLGGYDADGHVLASAEIYDPTTDSWDGAPSMLVPRAAFAVTQLGPGGLLLITGGTDGPPHYLDSAEIYDPTSATTGTKLKMQRAHVLHTATYVEKNATNDAMVVVVGGRGGYETDIVETYDVESKKFTLWPGDADAAYHGHTAVLLPNGEIFIGGGYDPYGPLDVTAGIVPQLQDKGFEVSLAPLSESRAYAMVTLLSEMCPDGSSSGDARKLFIAGGEGFNAEIRDSTEILDWETGAWQASPPHMEMPRSHAAMTMVNGYVIVIGGQTFGEMGQGSYAATSGVEGYDPCARAWKSMPPMVAPRMSHTVHALDRGRVFVIGGNSDTATLDSTEIFWPNDACSSHRDCSSDNRCSRGRCARIEDRLFDSADVVCNSQRDCPVESRCSNGRCVEAIAP